MRDLPVDSYPPLPLLTQFRLDTYELHDKDLLLQLLLHPPNLRCLTFPRSCPKGAHALIQLIDSTSLHSPASLIHTLQELHLPKVDSSYLAATDLVRILDNYRNIRVLTIRLEKLAQEMLLYWKNNYSTHSHNITTLNIRGDISRGKGYDPKVEVVLSTLQNLSFHDSNSLQVRIDARTNQLKNISVSG